MLDSRARGCIGALLALALAVALPGLALAASQTIMIADFNFTPATVTVNAGDSVTWRNTGSDPHTATGNAGAFDTGTLNPGQSKTVVFGTAGTFDYRCAIHTSMRGTVTVVAPVQTTPPPTPPPTAPPTIPPTPQPTTALTPQPTTAPTTVPTSAPTAAPATTTAPPSTAPSASPAASATAAATSSAAPTLVAAASPSATRIAVLSPARDGAPLPLIAGIVVLAATAGGVLFVLRRR